MEASSLTATCHTAKGQDAMQAAEGALSLSLSQLCYTTDQPVPMALNP